MACFKPRPTAINHGQYTIFFRIIFVILTIAILIEMVLVIVFMSFPTSDPKLFNIALLEVAPNSSSGRGAPIFSMGLRRSCARVDNTSPISCTTPKTPPRFDFSVLSPVEAELKDPIPIMALAIIWTGLGLWILFFISTFILALDAQYKGRYRREFGVQMLVLCFGLFGALFPFITWWFLSRLFDQIANIFDNSQDKFTAATGKAFSLIFSAYHLLLGTVAITMVFFCFYTATAKDPPDDTVNDPPGGTAKKPPGGRFVGSSNSGIGQPEVALSVNNSASQKRSITPGRQDPDVNGSASQKRSTTSGLYLDSSKFIETDLLSDNGRRLRMELIRPTSHKKPDLVPYTPKFVQEQSQSSNAQ